MWTLILVAHLAVYHGGGTAMESIKGFNSEQACTVAGNHWLETNKTIHYRTAVCVKMQ
jgi:hypothetical protein